MPINVRDLTGGSDPTPKIPSGPGYRYDPIEYDESEWKLTYQYTYENEHAVQYTFKDSMGGTHVRLVFKDKTIKDFD